MAKGKKGRPKGRAKKGDSGIIAKIRALITEGSGGVGTGGARRGRDIEDAVDAMQSGIDEARKR